MQTTSIEFTKRIEEKTTFVLDRTIYLRSYWGQLWMLAPNMVLEIIATHDSNTGQINTALLQVKTDKDAAAGPLSKWLNKTERIDEIEADEFWTAWYKGVGMICKANESYGNHIGANAEMVTLKIKEHEQ